MISSLAYQGYGVGKAILSHRQLAKWQNLFYSSTDKRSMQSFTVGTSDISWIIMAGKVVMMIYDLIHSLSL